MSAASFTSRREVQVVQSVWKPSLNELRPIEAERVKPNAYCNVDWGTCRLAKSKHRRKTRPWSSCSHFREYGVQFREQSQPFHVSESRTSRLFAKSCRKLDAFCIGGISRCDFNASIGLGSDPNEFLVRIAS